jgi:hypothetical protein
MSFKRAFVTVLGGCLFAAAGMAAASNLSSDRQVDYFAKGTHSFYVWCPGTSDYLANVEGANAEEAQMRLYNATKAAGRVSCWPVWQGRVLG